MATRNVFRCADLCARVLQRWGMEWIKLDNILRMKHESLTASS